MTLYKGLKDITTSDRVTKEVSDDYIRFTIHNATIPDSGTYFVVARNEFGTDRIFVTINVSISALWFPAVSGLTYFIVKCLGIFQEEEIPKF